MSHIPFELCSRFSHQFCSVSGCTNRPSRLVFTALGLTKSWSQEHIGQNIITLSPSRVDRMGCAGETSEHLYIFSAHRLGKISCGRVVMNGQTCNICRVKSSDSTLFCMSGIKSAAMLALLEILAELQLTMPTERHHHGSIPRTHVTPSWRILGARPIKHSLTLRLNFSGVCHGCCHADMMTMLLGIKADSSLCHSRMHHCIKTAAHQSLEA